RKELAGAIVKEIEEQDFKVIPVVAPDEKWRELRESLPPELKQALRDKYVARFDSKPYEEVIKELLKSFSLEPDPKDLYARIQGPKSDNPFWRVRTEYFENLNILARSFTEPESASYDRIIEVKPTLIEGGRGSGKTMILKSLEAVVNIYRSGKTIFRDGTLKYLGVYCRLTQGAFATQMGNVSNYVNEDTATRLFFSELTLRLAQAMIDEVRQCINQAAITMNATQETTVTREIARQVRPNLSEGQFPADFQGLKHMLDRELRSINDYLSRRILGEEPSFEGAFLGRSELSGICSSVAKTLPELSKVTIYFLLDEYENLHPFQKVVVNTLIKWSSSGCFTMKAATKKTGFQDPRTLEGQEIEQSNDYSLVNLDYDIGDSDHRQHYKKLLSQVCEKILQNEGFRVVDIHKLLQNCLLFDGIGEAEIQEKIAQLVEERGNKKWANLNEKDRKEYINRLQMGALYRVLGVKRRRKQFAGFDDLVLLSSGIIRFFLELCGMSYYFAVQDGINVKNGEQITRKNQTEAAYVLSSYSLSTLRRNIATHGPSIYQYAIDLGDIFRQKLLNHISEPEAARLSISDPQTLEAPPGQYVKQVLDVAEMHSVLQVPLGLGGIRPKHATEVQPREYLLNRIYSPVLQFSPRSRWRTRFKFEDIKALLEPELRQEMKAKLIRRVAKDVEDPQAKELESGPLFEKRSGDDLENA
ncbi:MAG TPA: hypothetical protein VJ044_18225, partial [Candidatus Hodarchaeales archaeon]|nr:hypothetical protein [Candidatus Hodarchaeales archaeon]